MRFRELIRRAGSFVQKDQLARDLEEEIRLHVELRARKLAAAGLADSEAKDAARRQFGNITQWKEISRAMWGWNALETFLQDAQYSVRMLRKTPVFSIVSVVTLALGIGMNTAIFSIVDAVMLRGLPYYQPERLVSLWEEVDRREDPSAFNTSGGKGKNAGRRGAKRTAVVPANLADYERTQMFSGLAGISLEQMNLTGSGEPARLYCERVTANYFRILGVSAARGRVFLQEDDRPDAELTVVLSDGLWKRRFGQDPSLLGRSILLDAKPHRVIGVLPAEFAAPDQFGLKDPIDFFVTAAYPAELLANRGDHEIDVVGRLADGKSIESAQAALDAVSVQLDKENPTTNRGIRAAIGNLGDDVVRGARTPLLVLLGAVGFVVLIACINVANLLLVRGLARRRETSVRFALGASRLRVIREFLTESILVSLAGCAAGLVLGRWLLQWLVSIAPANIPRLNEAQMNWRVFAASAALASLTGLIFGSIPAWQASQTKPVEALRGHGSGGAQTLRWRSLLTIVEVALSMVLLIGAGLLLRSFAGVLGVDLGFQPDRVLAVSVNLPETRYRTAADRLRFFEQLEERVRALPGVAAVAFANRMPLRGGWSSGFALETVPDKMIEADFQAVSPGYFETIGIPLVAGRTIGAVDRSGSTGIAIVNQTFVRQYMNGGAIGRRFRRGPKAPWITIAGVVNDIRRGGKTDTINPQVYLPAAQTGLYPVRLADFAIRSAGDPKSLARSIQSAVLAIDKDQPVTNMRTLDEIVNASVAQRRFQLLLILVFAAVALSLALIGIFGVVAHSVEQRTAELGIRVALGASQGSILGMILKQAAFLVGAGVAAGIAGALALSRSVESLLFGVAATDWRTYAAAAVALIAVSLAASAIPARKASRVDPLVALRYE